MKLDLFTIKAIQAKGYDKDELIKLTEQELDELPLPTKIIQAVKDYKARGGKTPDQIAEELADIMLAETPTVENVTVEEVVAEYKTNTEEQQVISTEIDDSVVIPEGEVEIVRKEASAEDIETINQALSEKEFKSFAPFLKHLKAAVPATILADVDGSKLNELIDARIAEVKAKNESTK